MGWTKLKSSNLKEARYVTKGKVLEVEFHGGGKYGYSGVPKKVFDDLCAAKSAGRFFASDIKGKYVYVNLNKKEEDKS